MPACNVVEVSDPDTPSRSVAHAKTVTPMVGGVLMIAPALMCLFFAVAWSIWPPLGWFVFRIELVDPYTVLFMGVSGVLAFALGFTAGLVSLLRRFFWLVVVCGSLFVIPELLVLSFSSILTGSPIGYPFMAALALVGLVFVAQSKKEFS